MSKAFVGMDEMHLTVSTVNRSKSWFTFMSVEFMQKLIAIPSENVGGLVNIKVDVLGRYAESVLRELWPGTGE